MFSVSASSATCLVYLGEMHTETRRDFAIASAISIVAFAFCIVPGKTISVLFSR